MLQSATAVALDAFMPPLAPLVLLAFLGAGFLIVCSAIASAVALALRRVRLGRFLGGTALAVASVYGALLVGASVLSRERTLHPGEKKYFCEMDCHLAYSVVATAAPGGGRRVVTVQTWFDPSTIASFRGNAPLWPNPRTVHLVDGAGSRYSPSDGPTKAWEAMHGDSTPLTRELRPGESYRSSFVFEVPGGASGLRLFLGDPSGPENLIIHHENSPFHAKTYFELPPASASLPEAHS
ncbi:MAG: DUF4352 domain-containing protein [Acidobacteriota bacterium]|nr:DUF4352 domain-containing protein [Acidobacteriota bacterium]